MNWILYSIFLILIAFIIFRNRFFHLPGLPRTASLYFFALKIIAGIALWYIYTFYYPQREYADIWKYFDDSEIVYDALDKNPGDYFSLITGIGIDDRIQQEYINKMMHWDQQFENNLFNDSHTIIRFNALTRLISAGNYHTHSLFMSFLAFIGLCAIYRWIYTYLFAWKKIIAFILFISPSLLFWSSGVLKEGILFFSLGLLIYQAWLFRGDRKKYRLVWIVITIALLAMTKLYMLVFILPALLIGMHLEKRPRFAFLKTTGLFAVLLATGIVIHLYIPAYSPFKIIATKQINFLTLAQGGMYIMDDEHVVFVSADQRDQLIALDSAHQLYMIGRNTKIMYWKIADDFSDTLYRTVDVEKNVYTLLSDNPVAGSLMDVRRLAPTPSAVLKESVPAFARSVFRPWPWEIKPVMVIPSLLENLFMYALLIFALIASKKPSCRSVVWFCIVYAVLMLTVAGLTTPVLGALVRYRIAAIPFLLFAIMLYTDKDRLMVKLPFLRFLF